MLVFSIFTNKNNVFASHSKYNLARENSTFLSMFLWENWSDSILSDHLPLPKVAMFLSLDMLYLEHRMLHSNGVAKRLRGARASVLSNSRLIAGSSGRSRVSKDRHPPREVARGNGERKKDINARECCNDGKKLMRHATTTIWVPNEARA